LKVGVMGGTFDPIHLGHLRAAETALEALGLDRVMFVPAGRPPHRTPPAASALDRYAMVALAVAEHPRFVASDLELRRDGPSFTVDTLESLRATTAGIRLTLIVGSDSIGELPGWRHAARILSLAQVAVVERPGDDSPCPPELSESVARVSGPALEVSATSIRARVAAGGSVRYLLPPAVADYIEKRALYR